MRTLAFGGALLLLFPVLSVAQDAVFSGPQVGEPLPSFKAVGMLDDQEGEPIDLIAQAEDGPVMLVFFHELTRPGFGLTRAITKFASERSDPNMKVGVIFLTDDMTETTKWASNVRRLFSKDVTYVVSPDGKEGPGSYGLNRNVTLTVIVGDDGKVTGNFALVQPQLQADGPGILKAVAAVTGGGEVPSINEFDPRRAREMQMRREGATDGRMRQRGDDRLSGMLRAVINKQASEEQVKEAASKIEAYVEKNEAARKELARIANTIVNSGKLANYGTAEAQATLKRWQKKYGESTDSTDESDGDSKSGEDKDEV